MDLRAIHNGVDLAMYIYRELEAGTVHICTTVAAMATTYKITTYTAA